MNLPTKNQNDTAACQASQIDEKLVFLVGPPRSGTTWLQGLLSNHPEIGTAQESHLFNHFLSPAMKMWSEMLEFEDGRGGIGLPAYLTEKEFLDLMRNTAVEVYSKVPDFHTNTLFLDKTPDHIRCISDIRRLFPEAKIIVLLRKPEDVIESILHAGKSWGKNWASSSIFSAVRQFQYFFSVSGTDELILNDQSICLVRYEELKASPAKTLNSVLNYLEMPVAQADLNQMIETPRELNKYGEFAKRSGTEVNEPDNFARKKKGKLSFLPKLFVSLATAKHTARYGYTTKRSLDSGSQPTESLL